MKIMKNQAKQDELAELCRLASQELLGSGESLVVWAGGDAVNQQDMLAKAFMDKFPNISIDIYVETYLRSMILKFMRDF